jgi:sirohydrochlorin cobaltochelatase
MRHILADLELWLESGGSRLGQILVARCEDGFELRHEADAGLDDLRLHEGAAAARALANVDEAGNYRPLKTAPNLRRGWRLFAPDLLALRKSLDAFYPAMLGVWTAHCKGKLAPVDLRDTLSRQTGMYRITQKITDQQAQDMIGRVCEPRAGCLKTILWSISPGVPITTLPPEKFIPPSGSRMPLFCHEACNILVACARKVVKGEAV